MTTDVTPLSGICLKERAGNWAPCSSFLFWKVKAKGLRLQLMLGYFKFCRRMTTDRWIYFPVFKNREGCQEGKEGYQIQKGTFTYHVVTLILVKLYTPIFRETELQDYFPNITFPFFLCREQGWHWRWFSLHTCVNTCGTPSQGGVQGLFTSKHVLIMDFKHTWPPHCSTLAHVTLRVIRDSGPIWVVRILKSLYLKFVFSKYICFLSF